jgi:hypothetical protein
MTPETPPRRFTVNPRLHPNSQPREAEPTMSDGRAIETMTPTEIEITRGQGDDYVELRVLPDGLVLRLALAEADALAHTIWNLL